jgi:hypothetical protein
MSADFKRKGEKEMRTVNYEKLMDVLMENSKQDEPPGKNTKQAQKFYERIRIMFNIEFSLCELEALVGKCVQKQDYDALSDAWNKVKQNIHLLG